MAEKREHGASGAGESWEEVVHRLEDDLENLRVRLDLLEAPRRVQVRGLEVVDETDRPMLRLVAEGRPRRGRARAPGRRRRRRLQRPARPATRPAARPRELRTRGKHAVRAVLDDGRRHASSVGGEPGRNLGLAHDSRARSCCSSTSSSVPMRT